MPVALPDSENAHLLDNFYVVAVMTNPERFKTRPRLFKEFMARMEKYGAKLYVVEGAYGDRTFEVTEEGNPRHIQLRTDTELWHKENLINIGISRLPASWEYVAWVDGDIDFTHPNWMEETVHELQHHPVVQMYEDAADLGPKHEILAVHKSFAYCYKNSNDRSMMVSKPSGVNVSTSTVVDISGADYGYYGYGKGAYWHPGYCWAATREAINTLGGLFDLAILGAGDHHMACCLIGEGERSIPKDVHPNYQRAVLNWQQRALRLHKNIGYVSGSIVHYWHGKKADRQYKGRWEIAINNQFDPHVDIHKDWQGLWTLYPGHEEMRDQIRVYFQSRNEDSVDKA
jgi:hypothetical protein